MNPFLLAPEDRATAWTLAALAFAQAVVLFLSAWFGAGGHFMLPLDDSYIHLQYARTAAGGSPLVYTQGMAPSGGMTSPAYVALLVPLFWLGLSGVKGALAAFAIGAVLWVWIVVWTYQLGKVLLDGPAGLLAALLVLANGHLLWNSLSGMETALFTMLLLGALLGAARWWLREEAAARRVLLACLVLLPLVRPEGAAVTAGVALLIVLRMGEAPRLSLVKVLLTLVPFLAWLAILQAATGSWRPAGLVVKGLSEYPYLLPVHKLQLMSETAWSAVLLFYTNVIPDRAYAEFKGMEHMPYVVPGFLLLLVVGVGFALAEAWRTRRAGPWLLVVLAWLAGMASLLGTYLPFVHQQRYLSPWTIPAILLAVYTIRELARLFHRREELAFQALSIGFVALSLPSLLFWTAEYGRNSRDIYEALRQATFPLAEEEQPFAMTDAGVLAYYTDLPAWDLVGLTSIEFTRATGHGEGATLAVLAGLPEDRRPRLLLTYPGWFSEAFPLRDPEWGAGFTRRPSITSGAVTQAYPIDWEMLARGAALPVGAAGPVLYGLNVASLPEEAALGYQPEWDAGRLPSLTWPAPLAPVVRFVSPAPLDPDALRSAADSPAQFPGLPAVDGGRRVAAEAFTLALPEGTPWEGLRLYHRAAGTGAEGLTLRVSATSNTTGYTATRDVDVPPSGEGAAEWMLDLGDLLDEVGGNVWRVRVEALAPATDFVSLRYWVAPAPAEQEFIAD